MAFLEKWLLKVYNVCNRLVTLSNIYGGVIFFFFGKKAPSLMCDRVVIKPLIHFFRLAYAYQGWTNSFLGALLKLRARSGTQKNGCSKSKCTSDQDTIRKIAFCSSLPK